MSIIICVLLFGVSSCVEGKIAGVGPCRLKPTPDYKMDLDKFATENNGIWSYMVVQEQELTKNLIKMSLVLKPTCIKGNYSLEIYIENKGENPRKTVETFIYGESPGVATLDMMDGNTPVKFHATFMKFEPGFAVYYICSEDGGDDDIDYRFALAHKPLTEAQEQYMNNLQNKYHFRGTLRKLQK